MAREKPGLLRHLSDFFSGTSELGMKPVIVLDNSSIIQLEQVARRSRGYVNAHLFLSDLVSTASPQQATLLVPRCIVTEATDHHHFQTVNGRPEISENTLNALYTCPFQVKKVLEYLQTENGALTHDTFRYYLREHHYKNLKGKKATRDPISPNDWDVVDTSLALALYSVAHFRKNLNPLNQQNPQRDCYRVAVLSSDKHIIWSLDEAFKLPDGACLTDYLRPINTAEFQVS